MAKKKNKAVGKSNVAPPTQDKNSGVHAPVNLSALSDNSLLHIACLVFTVILIYANAVDAPFQWDETSYIVGNPIVKNLHYFSNPSDARGLGLYNAMMLRYIGYLTFSLDYRLHGTSVTGYHIVNIAIPAANSILVYLLVLLTFRTPFFLRGVNSGFSRFTFHDTRLIAFFSALIFAAHPLQTEAVTYVFQRFASLSALFYLLSLVMYILSRSEDRPRRIFYYSMAFISALLAMKTKENAFTLPITIILYEFCFFNDAQRPALYAKRFYYLVPIVLTLAIVPLTLMNLTGNVQLDPGEYGAKLFSRSEYLFTQFRVIVTYIRLLFFPIGQNFDYDYPIFQSFFAPPVVLSFVFLAALFALGVYLIMRTKDKGLRLAGFGILWFFITLSVESTIIPIPMIINEYRVYLPSVGLIISVISGAFLLASRAPVFLFAALFLATAVLSVSTHLRNLVWADDVRLWEDTVKKSPDKARTHFSLANHYASLKMYDEAIEQHMIAIRLKPDYAEAYNNLGSIYKERGMLDSATEQYITAVKLSPDSASAHNNLGNIYQARNMPSAAEEQYLFTLKLKPDFAEGHYNLGLVYQTRGMHEKAVQQYIMAIDLAPDYTEAHNNLGSVYQLLNMFDKAIEQYAWAVTLKPDYPEARFNLGLAYYKTGQMGNARRELTECLRLKPDHEKALHLLKEISR
ncbi:MAG: tetratricopeptide repeat protein [Nitrospirae bacterium]|nr:tetratricopeptide repeat protein [Nitrospirota bacterium]